MNDEKIEFGDIVKDVVSKVEGVVTGYSKYVTGCEQFLVQPIEKNKTTKLECFWLDEGRLKKIGVDKETKSIIKTKTGADMEAPLK